ncbi:hypothetical protein CN906_20700 [Bacillus toyonensis]|uniref:hypothetical protein n=1 Tax=Bacillus toyonensis TaxID=155322 RepID=UPI000BF19F2B|nr:hypothetical protein [Bacillus toyonensis]PEJ62418.1 hypothetical protein CN906_20700 [Bacillus toyonensis]PGB31890.1 hypothetical protein COM16_17170 [Bacillus toyonensis]PHG54329.1 hypothetical protein COI57_01620 [Bacillus toyonensis]
MKSLDLLPIVDKAWQSTKNKEAVYNAILKELLNLVPLAQKMFEHINNLVLKQTKKIEIEVTSKDGAGYTAYTRDYKKSIVIYFTSPMECELAKSVFVHELGEVEYIVSGHPFFDDPSLSIMYRIVEMFSHPRIRALSKQYGLGDIEEQFSDELSIQHLKLDYLNQYQKKWEIVAMVSWAIITFPNISLRKEEVSGYTEYGDEIEKILSIRRTVNTCSSNHKEVRKAFDDIVGFLKELGMPDPGKVICIHA